MHGLILHALHACSNSACYLRQLHVSSRYREFVMDHLKSHTYAYDANNRCMFQYSIFAKTLPNSETFSRDCMHGYGFELISSIKCRNLCPSYSLAQSRHYQYLEKGSTCTKIQS